MPAVLPSTKEQPYLTMARFETGASGNPHFHGFSIGSGGPRLGRVDADLAEDGRGDKPPASDDDGIDPEAVKAAEAPCVESDADAADADDEADAARATQSAEVPPPPPPKPVGERPPKRRKPLVRHETAPGLPRWMWITTLT